MSGDACLVVEPTKGCLELSEDGGVQRSGGHHWRRVDHRDSDVDIFNDRMHSAALLSPNVLGDRQPAMAPGVTDTRALSTERRTRSRMLPVAAGAAGEACSWVILCSTVLAEGCWPVPHGVVVLVFVSINSATLFTSTRHSLISRWPCLDVLHSHGVHCDCTGERRKKGERRR